MKNFKYAVGQIVYTKNGKGTVKKIDTKDKHFTYFINCEDGTVMWCHENDLSDKPIIKEPKEDIYENDLSDKPIIKEPKEDIYE